MRVRGLGTGEERSACWAPRGALSLPAGRTGCDKRSALQVRTWTFSDLVVMSMPSRSVNPHPHPIMPRLAAAAGTGIGAVLALAKGHPILRFTATSAISFTALGALYTGVSKGSGAPGVPHGLPGASERRPGSSAQALPSLTRQATPRSAGIEETCRLVRCHASPVNAAVAGAAVGSIVHRANGEWGWSRGRDWGEVGSSAAAERGAGGLGGKDGKRGGGVGSLVLQAKLPPWRACLREDFQPSPAPHPDSRPVAHARRGVVRRTGGRGQRAGSAVAAG